MQNRGCQISLYGPLTIRSAAGDDLTPKGAKARALIALLAQAPDRRRSRRWVEAKLWSIRGQQQAAGSLRQTLSEIRTALGPLRDILGADRADVWLDANLITTDLDEGAKPEDASREILEGIDVRDPEFEEWLRLLRQSSPASVPLSLPFSVPTGIGVHCSSLVLEAGIDRIAAQTVADQIGLNLEETLAGSTMRASARGSELAVTVDVSRDGQTRVLQARVLHLETDRVLHSAYRAVPVVEHGLISEDLIAEFAHATTSRALARLPQVLDFDRTEVVASGFAALAQKKYFEFTPTSFTEAQDLMERAQDTHGSGLYLAWLGFIRMTEVVESLAEYPSDQLEETEALLRHAVEASPENGQVHALKALTELMLFDDIDAGINSAEDAFRRNPNNLLVRQSLAVAAATSGDKEAAYQMSAFCRPGVAREDGRHLWDLYHSLVCVSTGRFEEAREAAERAVRSCPDFRAPRRQLAGLYASFGDHDAAAKHFRALQKWEPDLTADQFLSDEEYPVRTLRNAGLLEFPVEALKQKFGT